MFYDHKWSQLEDHEKEQIKKHYNYNNAKQKWQDAKAAADYRAHHSANPGNATSGSTLTNGATFPSTPSGGGSTPVPTGVSFDMGGPNVGPTVNPPMDTSTPPPSTGGTKPPPPTYTSGGSTPIPGNPTFDFDKPKDPPPGTGGVPGTEFQYNGPSDTPEAGSPPPGGGEGPDVPNDYEPPKTGDGLGPTFGENSWEEQMKDDYQSPFDLDELNYGIGYDDGTDKGGSPGGGTNPGGNTYVYGSDPGQGGQGGNATISEGAINITIGDLGGGYGPPGEQTEVGYLGGGGAGLSKFDPGAFMGGLQASLPTWKGGGKAQATGMFNSRMNLGRN